MATPTDIERVSYGGPTGSLQLGRHCQVIQGVGATRTLLAKESGALCMFDVATGNIYTLPTPVEGMYFDFQVGVSVTTSDVHKVITSASTVFLLGGITVGTIATASAGGFSANGTNIISVTLNATTDGGLIGGYFRTTAISTTQWVVQGFIYGSGTVETPFQTT